MNHTIDLQGRCRLVFRETADGHCGLHEVALDGILLRNPRLSIQPVWATPDGLLFGQLPLALPSCRLETDQTRMCRACPDPVSPKLLSEEPQ